MKTPKKLTNEYKHVPVIIAAILFITILVFIGLATNGGGNDSTQEQPAPTDDQKLREQIERMREDGPESKPNPVPTG